MKKFLFLAVFASLGAFALAEPTVDGKVATGEYAHSKSVMGGKATLNWALDADGGLSVALSAKTKGWAAVGFGSSKMDGSYIYFGFVGQDGKPVFTEQSGKGHRHTDSGKVTADQSVVAMAGETTVLEFHVPAANLPFSGTNVPFIVATGETADLKTYHGGSRDAGVISLK